MITQRDGSERTASEVASESTVQDGGEKGVELSCGFGLEALEGGYLGSYLAKDHLRFARRERHLVGQEILRVQAATPDVGAGALACDLWPDGRCAEICVEDLGKGFVLVYLEHRKFRRDNAAIALWWHDSEGALPGHQLWVNEVSGSKAGESGVREVHPALGLAAEDAATEAVDAGELIGLGGLDWHVRWPKGDKVAHRGWCGFAVTGYDRATESFGFLNGLLLRQQNLWVGFGSGRRPSV